MNQTHQQNSRKKALIPLIFSLALLPSYALAELNTPHIPITRNLPLECTPITGRLEQLCIIKTESPYGPYDDISYYHINSKNHTTLLGSERGG
ncbi:MAG: hypothetical protein OEL79_06555, partial [Chromatiales bacterium]|nr:hypothetical protein [Chromatiales bacterium]